MDKLPSQTLPLFWVINNNLVINDIFWRYSIMFPTNIHLLCHLIIARKSDPRDRKASLQSRQAIGGYNRALDRCWQFYLLVDKGVIYRNTRKRLAYDMPRFRRWKIRTNVTSCGNIFDGRLKRSLTKSSYLWMRELLYCLCCQMSESKFRCDLQLFRVVSSSDA